MRYERSVMTNGYVIVEYLNIDNEGYGHHKVYINNRLTQTSVMSKEVVEDELKKHEWVVIGW